MNPCLHTNPLGLLCHLISTALPSPAAETSLEITWILWWSICSFNFLWLFVAVCFKSALLVPILLFLRTFLNFSVVLCFCETSEGVLNLPVKISNVDMGEGWRHQAFGVHVRLW